MPNPSNEFTEEPYSKAVRDWFFTTLKFDRRQHAHAECFGGTQVAQVVRHYIPHAAFHRQINQRLFIRVCQDRPPASAQPVPLGSLAKDVEKPLDFLEDYAKRIPCRFAFPTCDAILQS